jgi:transposase-like protein
MLKQALEAEVEEYISAHKHERDDKGHATVVRNGKARARQVTMGSGTVEIEAPRVNDKRVDEDGERQKFTSAILLPYMRRSPKVTEVLPLLYLRGLSTGDFKPALESLLGENASGLSPSTITRMTTEWEEEHERFSKRSLADRDFVYVWADGIHVNVRLDDDRVCLLVIIGARPDGEKEVIAIEDGHRESKESWLDVLRKLKTRGMQPPAIAVGDGALGFWAAVREVWPETREQRCWFHKLGNVIDKLPKSLQSKAKAALHEIGYAEGREAAGKAIEAFATTFGAKHPKAVECLRKDESKMLTFFDFPAEHWKHLRTSNVIESTFATVRLRTRVTKGPGCRKKALTMAFKLLQQAQARWRRLDGHQLLPLVRAGVKFVDGVRQERSTSEEEAA